MAARKLCRDVSELSDGWGENWKADCYKETEPVKEKEPAKEKESALADSTGGTLDASAENASGAWSSAANHSIAAPHFQCVLQLPADVKYDVHHAWLCRGVMMMHDSAYDGRFLDLRKLLQRTP